MGGLNFNHFKLEANFCDGIDKVCKQCKNLQSQCICNIPLEVKNRDSYTLWINSQKRKGKDITLCGIFYEEKSTMQKILKKIKKTLACGGSLKVDKKGYLLEFQGKHLEILKKLLKKESFYFNK
ncbi:translation initiation factor [Helicobacter apodemus]|uniref:Translation initiation factor n=1 Tax=Helicobacter apodemus TaxID=135569 RepID=A0A2U8FBU6_9HELI|nr:translation initiation factor [Helicobacter apodemus]AWI33624.1 translation initiation factor [Helicobacter apodemus]